MKKTTIIMRMDKAGRLTKGRGRDPVRVPRGRTMDADAVRAAAKADRDARPLTKKQMSSMKRVPQVKVLRRALGLTQEEFSVRFQIPLGTLRDWEQGRAEPDMPTRAYLKVIARDPDGVRKALQPA